MTYVNFDSNLNIWCNHPRVKRIWQLGGGSTDSIEPCDYTCLILDNEEKIDFRTDKEGRSYAKAEKYLTELK